MTIGDIILAKAAEKNAKNADKTVANMFNAVENAKRGVRLNDTRTDAERTFDAGRTRRPKRKHPDGLKRVYNDPFQAGQKAANRRIDIDFERLIDFDTLDECAPVPNRDEPCFIPSVSGSVELEDVNGWIGDIDNTAGTIITIR